MDLRFIKDASRAKLIHLFKKYLIKRKVLNLHIWFLRSCLKENLTPKFINIKTSINNTATKKMIALAQKIWIKEELKSKYVERDRINLQLYYVHGFINCKLHATIFDALQSKCLDTIEDIGKNVYFKLNNKLIRLRMSRLDNRQISKNDKNIKNHHKFQNRIVNTSNTVFNDSELKILGENLKSNFNFVVKKDDIHNLAIESEIIINKSNLPDNQKSFLKNKVAKSLSHTQNNKCNQFDTDHKTTKNIALKFKTENLTLIKADKGNCNIVVNRREYIDSVNNFIENQNYIKIKNNPVDSHQRNLKLVIKKYNDIIKEFVVPKFLIITNPQPPLLYCLPKIHKTLSTVFKEIPLRPVVSQINSPTCKMAKWLNTIFRSKTNWTATYSVKNSIDLIDKIKGIIIPDNAFLISFDIINLFPSVPSNECLPLIRDILASVDLNSEFVDMYMDCLMVCLNQNFFKFDNKFYKQEDGLSMGNSLSPLLSEIFLDNMERNYIAKNTIFQNNIIAWYRYVDDIFCIFNGNENQLNDFLIFINNIHNSINFTFEKSRDDGLPFLDLIINIHNSKLNFNIFRKPTHTDNVIPFHSNHPIQYKLAAFNSFIDRLIKVPLSKTDFDWEKQLILQIAVTNGYNPSLIHNLINKKLSRYSVLNLTGLTPSNNDFKNAFCLTYIGLPSIQLSNIFNSCNIKVVFKTKSSNFNLFCKFKDIVPPLYKAGIYRLECKDCNAIYIGMTTRNINIRVKEHFRLIKNNNNFKVSAFADHILNANHNFDSNSDFSILHSEDNYNKLFLLEQLEIFKHNVDDRYNVVNDIIFDCPYIVASL